MQRQDIQASYDFFEYLRLTDSAPPADRQWIDVAVLDMNHAWPNVGHDAVVHILLDLAEEFRSTLVRAGVKVRALSYDVRRRLLIPEPPNGRFSLYIGTGGPGHLDPHQNDGAAPESQGIREDTGWEAPLFRLYDSILADRTAALIGICHSFGEMCRWSGVARPVARDRKSSGIPTNVLTDGGTQHPWFSRFAGELADHRHFQVIDNRLFDLMLDDSRGVNCLAFEHENSAALTMIEFARDAEGRMPRVFGMNHHPEIIDREHVLAVLKEKRERGEVTDAWYQERADTLRNLLHGNHERQSRLTSEYTLVGPLRHHVGRLVAERCETTAAGD
jgi:hypothetical protein